LIPAIDLWVVRKAIALIAAYKCGGQRVALNVNLSGKSIADPKLAGFIENALVEGGIDPAYLVFEITETAAVANLPQARVSHPFITSRISPLITSRLTASSSAGSA